MKRALSILLIALGVVCLIALALWLNLPGSAVMFFHGIGAGRHPASFTFRLANLPKTATSAAVNLTYMPKTPILGISEHYWSIIAPLRIDVIRRDVQAPIDGGTMHFEVPLAVVGLSNYRLSTVTISLPSGGDEPLVLGLGETSNEDPPVTMTIPLARIENGTYRFEGPYALWKLTGAREEDNGRAYSPRATDTTRQVIWPDLRAVDAQIDFAPYPVPTFQAPVGWQAEGWAREGINLARPGAQLTDQQLTMKRGTTLTIPFSRDCAAVPEFVMVSKRAQPAWSSDPGLWAPVSVATWQSLKREGRPDELVLTFVPSAHGSADGVEGVRVRAVTAGTYRVFAACPAAHAASVAVAWLDVIVQ